MKTFSKALVGTAAAAAVALYSASPAVARDNRGGIDGGDIMAGALVIGGIAALAAAAGSKNSYAYGYDDRGRSGWNENRFGRSNPRQAVAQCVRAAERNAVRASYGRADVTDVRDVRSTRFGYEVRGRIAVNAQGRNWRNGDYQGWNASMRGYDSGSFRCRVERGRVIGLDYSGIRGL